MTRLDSSKDDKAKLFKHFEKFPLLTQKAADSILFKQVVDLINNKEHLTLEGINKIVNIKASMNLGLSDMLKSEFQNNNSVKRPVINSDNIDIPNNWIAGFVSGEGCFDVRITKSTSHFTGYRVQLRLRVSQHERDTNLMKNIILKLKTGNLYKYSKQPAVNITIVSLTDITRLVNNTIF